MSWHVSPWIYPLWDFLRFLHLINYFLSHIREVFNYNLLKYFLRSFLLLFFWAPYNFNTGVFNVVPEVSETVLSSFHSFFFILLCDSYFHCFIFQVTYPFLCLSYSPTDSFYRIFNLINLFFIIVCLLFSSSRSLLKVSCYPPPEPPIKPLR